MASNRIGRINEEIQRELAELIRSLKDPRVQTMISITRVDTTPDLRYSKIYVSVLEEARSQDALRGLKSAGGWLRRELGSRSAAALYAGACLHARRFAQIRRAYVRSSREARTAGRLRGRRRRPMTRAEFCAFARAHDNFVILTHRRPDGDTIGSAGALCLGLRQLGKTAFVLTNEQFTPRFDPFLDGLVCEALPAGATVISADIASEGLFVLRRGAHGPHARLRGRPSRQQFPCLPEACRGGQGRLRRDHPRDPAGAWRERYKTDRGVPVCGDLDGHGLLQIFQHYVQYPPHGRCADRGGCGRVSHQQALFRYQELFPPPDGGKADGDDGVFTQTERSACASCPSVCLRNSSATEDDLDSISGFARSIEGVRIGVMIREVEDGLGKISLRTEAPYDAAQICGLLGGGGHAAAAGASVPGGVEGAKAAILQALRDSGVKL